jgi:hypothetical protein
MLPVLAMKPPIASSEILLEEYLTQMGNSQNATGAAPCAIN